MNNSDIIAALSLAITAIIFLVQTDDGLLKLKTRKHEKRIVAGIVLVIVLLTNYQIFERFDITFYFNLSGKYLLPTEWALLLFLYLLGVTLYRIFTPKIFIRDRKIIFNLIDKYRREKKWNKLQNLLLQVMDIKEFEQQYAEHLNDTIFNDHHLIEHFASDFPELLIKFSQKYDAASINDAEHFFYILNGLFADKSNSIFSEIRQYHNDDEKRIFLEDIWSLKYDSRFKFDPVKNYRTELPIISWLTGILDSFPTSLKEEPSYFLRQFPQTASEKNNEEIYSGKEIQRLLSRDTVFNVIRLFRILLIEFSFNNKQAPVLIDRVLLLLYSSWDFIEESTQLKSEEKVALDNDSYTINEFFLKYLFNAYLSIFFLLRFTRSVRINKENEKHDSSTWPIKQLFAKLDSLIGHEGVVSERSKEYYIEALFDMYFEMNEYFKDDQKEGDKVGDILLWYIKDSLKASPYGDAELFRKTFFKVCKSFDFIQYDSNHELQRAKHLYKYLLPYTTDYKWRITQSNE
jgi:hypothetical protein